MPPAGGPATRLLERERRNRFPASMAPDGTILFVERAKGNAAGLSRCRPAARSGRSSSRPSARPGPRLSPDGRAVAYISDETGRGRSTWPVPKHGRALAGLRPTAATSRGGLPTGRSSSTGRAMCRWRDGERRAASSGVGDSRRLFQTSAASGRAVAGGATRCRPTAGASSSCSSTRGRSPAINVVQNWFEELKARVGPRCGMGSNGARHRRRYRPAPAAPSWCGEFRWCSASRSTPKSPSKSRHTAWMWFPPSCVQSYSIRNVGPCTR